MLTSKDIRLAYAALHGVTSIAEYEKYDLMNANQYPPEWLELPIDEFMVMAGFVSKQTTLLDLHVNAQKILGENSVDAKDIEATKKIVNKILSIGEVSDLANSVAKRIKAQAEEKPKRKYTKKQR